MRDRFVKMWLKQVKVEIIFDVDRVFNTGPVFYERVSKSATMLEKIETVE